MTDAAKRTSMRPHVVARMRRRLTIEEAAGAIRDPETGELSARSKPKPRSKTLSPAAFAKAVAETQRMMESCDWALCGARHIVALYEIMHERVYKVPVEASSAERRRFQLLVGAFVKRVFDGDYAAMVDYFRWVWSREIGQERWRREHGKEGRVLGLPLLLTGGFVTQYRVNRVRRPHDG